MRVLTYSVGISEYSENIKDLLNHHTGETKHQNTFRFSAYIYIYISKDFLQIFLAWNLNRIEM